jgi:hypothetical protein
MNRAVSSWPWILDVVHSINVDAAGFQGILEHLRNSLDILKVVADDPVPNDIAGLIERL